MSTSPASPLVLDRAGFPMIWLTSINAYMHCFPVTKIQLEYFLCDTANTRFGAEFYDRLLAANPRESADGLNKDNYYHALATGIKPDEAFEFAEWCGEDREETLELPSRRDWYDAYKESRGRPAIAADELVELGVTPRVELLLRRLDSSAAARQPTAASGRTLADAMLFHLGVYEWVRCEDGQWRGAGKPHPNLGAPMVDLTAEKPRSFAGLDSEIGHCGFRLLKRVS